MFARKKELKEIKDNLQRIEKEKEELLKIKELLDDVSPKVDISDVYVWEHEGISYIVRQYVNPFVGRNFGGIGELVNAYESTLVDIFNNKVIFQKSSMVLIEREEKVKGADGTYFTGSYAYFNHILNVDRTLLAYPDKKVPLYVLQQTYYKLNNIDITKVKTK